MREFLQHIIRLTLCLMLSVPVLMPGNAATENPRRRITPVSTPKGTNENRTDNILDRSRLKEVTDAHGHVILVDTVSGIEVPDTTVIPQVVGNIYPLFNGVTVGVNVYDAAMRILGQQYGIGSVRASVSLHNRFMPFAEAGLSVAGYTPDGNNYTFHSPAAPFLKIGGGYNIFYNSDPAYQLTFGIGYGFTAFSYGYRDVTIDEGYWRDPAHIDLPSHTATAGYLELGAALKVKIAGPVSAGWSLAYHTLLHESKNRYGPAVIIPGYGRRDSPFSISVFVMYDLPLNKKAPKTVDLTETQNTEL